MFLFQQGVNLTPAQRASLKAIQGLIFTAGIAALDAAVQYFSHNSDLSAFNWSQFITLVIGAGFTSLLYTANKLRTAPHDPPLVPAGADMTGEAGPSVAAPVAAAGPLVVIHTAAPPVVSTPLTLGATTATTQANSIPGYTAITYGTSAGPAPIIIRSNTPPVAPTITPSDTVTPAEGEAPTQTPG